MTPKEIIILMKLLDITQTSIARKLKVTVPAVNAVIKDTRQNPRIRQAIADAIGRPVEFLWPPEEPKKVLSDKVNQILDESQSEKPSINHLLYD